MGGSLKIFAYKIASFLNFIRQNDIYCVQMDHSLKTLVSFFSPEQLNKRDQQPMKSPSDSTKKSTRSHILCDFSEIPLIREFLGSFFHQQWSSYFLVNNREKQRMQNASSSVEIQYVNINCHRDLMAIKGQRQLEEQEERQKRIDVGKNGPRTCFFYRSNKMAANHSLLTHHPVHKATGQRPISLFCPLRVTHTQNVYIKITAVGIIQL